MCVCVRKIERRWLYVSYRISFPLISPGPRTYMLTIQNTDKIGYYNGMYTIQTYTSKVRNIL